MRPNINLPFSLAARPRTERRSPRRSDCPAARELVQKQDNSFNLSSASEEELKKRTLTNHYNERPTWLDLAHQKLDRAVFAAYG